MAVGYGDIIYNIVGIYVAPLTNDVTGVYGTPAFIERGMKLSWDYTSDEDEIKSYGQVTDALTIITKGEGTLDDAAMNFDAVVAMTGVSQSSSGSTPNASTLMKVTTGGAGFGYFGMAAAYAATGGANLVVGIPKCMLKTFPAFTSDQNKFRTSSIGIKFFSPSTTIRELVKYTKNETAGALPSTAGAFNAYFAGMF